MSEIDELRKEVILLRGLAYEVAKVFDVGIDRYERIILITHGGRSQVEADPEPIKHALSKWYFWGLKA